jgi:hypothetical protein
MLYALTFWDLSTKISYMSTITNSTLRRFFHGGVRTATRVPLVLVFVVIFRWSKYAFVIFIIFEAIFT